MNELKVHIKDYKKVEEQLARAGAAFSEEINVVDTYFKQPAGKVLKISETNKGAFLVSLQAKDEGFEIVKNEQLEDGKKSKKELHIKFGIKCVVKKKRRFFDFEENHISIELIENVGEFLILTGENISKDIITDKIGMENPKFITVSFDALQK